MLVQIRPDTIAVPLPLFATVYNEAERAFRTEPGPYTAGVVAAFRWVAGFDETAPITGRPGVADREAMWAEERAAYPIAVQDSAADRRIDWRYAAGVSSAVTWALGAVEQPPVTLR